MTSALQLEDPLDIHIIRSLEWRQASSMLPETAKGCPRFNIHHYSTSLSTIKHCTKVGSMNVVFLTIQLAISRRVPSMVRRLTDIVPRPLRSVQDSRE